MAYRIMNAQGENVAGDAVLDEIVKAAALLVDGWVEDDAGNVVYTSPGRRDALAAEEPESLTGVVTPLEEA